MTDIAERDGDRGEQIINYASMHWSKGKI
jgi:hypothetical protein